MRVVGIPRFDDKVVAYKDCWLWVAGKNHQGYGKFWWEGKTVTAHRFVYINLVGSVPEGMHIDHICRHRACVNPAHLRLLTPYDNIDGQRRKTHCPRGHPYTHRNINGDRCCRPCNAAAARRRRVNRKNMPCEL